MSTALPADRPSPPASAAAEAPPFPWVVPPIRRPLTVLEEDLWTVEAFVPRIGLWRRMTLFRLADGRVVVHSAVCLPEDEMARIEAWGRLSILVVPSAYHRIDAPRWKARYPDLAVYSPVRGRRRIGARVAIDAHFDAFPSDERLACEPLDGIRLGEAVFRFRSAAGTTLVFNDAFFNQPHAPGLGGLAVRLAGSTGGPRVTKIMRLFGIDDRRAYRAHLERLAAVPDLTRVVPGHGDVLEARDSPAEVLREVAATL